MSSILNPAGLIEKLDLRPAMTVADFGCGSGYFVVEIAKAVGDKGRVYAVDVLPTALESVRSLAKMRGLMNIETRWANLEKTSTLDKDSCDFIFLSNILFQVENKYWAGIFEEINRVLKPTGQALIIDWKSDSHLGPPKNQRVPGEKIKDLAARHLKFIKNIDVGDDHWGLLFRK